MSEQQREADYLSKAKEAQEQVLIVKDSTYKEGWRKVAEGYRILASTPRC